MSSRDQPTPPFNSPYQQALRSASLLQSPAYPSPARSDSVSEPSKYPPDGLGLYSYSQPFPASGPPTSSVLYPPSPQPTEAWAHLSTGTSPLVPDPIVDPWTSGAYDHPVSRSPLPWGAYQPSHRSSLSSSTREMSIFSGDGSEHGFPPVKLEGSEWATDEESPPGTVAPERLTATGMFAYEQSYGTSPMTKFESTPSGSYEHRHSQQLPHEGRPKSSQDDDGRPGVTPRVRRRRQKIPAEEAKYSCDICGRGFIRSYNQKTHMHTHNPQRPKDHPCMYRDCDKKFVRKTDLHRHCTSVHKKAKDFKCCRCTATFSRKDTLRRHEEDGCPKRNELSDPNLLSRTRSMRTAPVPQMPYYHSPRPDMYSSTPVPVGYQSAEAAQDFFATRPHHHQGVGAYDTRSPLFREDSFGATSHGL
ncbi:hypothetical protein BU26DRAFT_302716 [Trematosphaeria pertusa]|uniref:C2H2 type master regulator of conidiophore development brlA n=1 Tax=Trematosphaeria pertusa TaxID=390896 RepID=A0A6A6IEK6_9PLEO|nr:uncharacterized protein BU26DRAFT_302716 [Trematosphaeria pertusa]KAF2248637.1 hypothetical protein BU26DRAFT_302716 [Trematosphaeria pertusa]